MSIHPLKRLPFRSKTNANFCCSFFFAHSSSTLNSPRLLAESNIKGRNQSLSQPERENKLGARHQELGHQTLEESTGALVLSHVGQDTEARLGVVEVAVLDTGLDDVKGGRDDKRSRGTSDGSDKVLEPRRLVVVVQTKEELLGEGGTAKQRKRAGRVAGGRPAPAAVQVAEAFVLDDLEDATALEGLGVGLALDLEDVEGKQNNLANANERAGRRVHDGLARLLAKSVLKVLAVVGAEEVTGDGLTAVLVDALENLVAGGVAETGEERDEFATEGGLGLVLEDDLVKLGGVGDLGRCKSVRGFWK